MHENVFFIKIHFLNYNEQFVIVFINPRIPHSGLVDWRVIYKSIYSKVTRGQHLGTEGKKRVGVKILNDEM